MKITTDKIQQLIQEALEGYLSPEINSEARNILMGAHALANQLLRIKSLYDSHKDDPNFWKLQLTKATKGSRMNASSQIEQIFQTVFINPTKQLYSHLEKINFQNPETKKYGQELLKLIKQILYDVNLVIDSRIETNSPLGNQQQLTAKGLALRDYEKEKNPNNPLTGQAELEAIHQKKIIYMKRQIEQILFSYIQNALDLYRQSRSFYQNSTNSGTQQPDFNKDRIVPQESLKTLQEIDDTVMHYYTAIEALFRALFSIYDDMKAKSTSSMEKIFGIKPPENPEVEYFDSNYQQNREKRKNYQKYDTAARRMFTNVVSKDGVPPDAEYWDNKKPFNFNKDIFIGFLTGKIETKQKQNSETGAVEDISNFESQKYPYEYKKAKIINHLLDEIHIQDKKIEILFAAKDVGGYKEDGDVHKNLWNESENKYLFPEIADMWRNMINVKTNYKKKFGELYSAFESFEYEDPAVIFKNQQTGMSAEQNKLRLQSIKVQIQSAFDQFYNGTPQQKLDAEKRIPELNRLYKELENKQFLTQDPKKQYKDMQEFMEKEIQTLTMIIRMIQYSKVEFKNIMNKMLTGEDMSTPENEVASQIGDNRGKLIKSREDTWQKLQALGMVNGPMPDWAYSK